MAFIQFAIANPVKVAVGVILTVMFGLLAFWATPVQLIPDVTEPELTVTTIWPGASAQEIEREIIEEQEEQLKSVEGLREFKSESVDSMGTIHLKFEVGTDLTVARAKVSDKLNQVPEYPPDANEPTITEGDANAQAIAWFMLKPLPPTAQELAALVVEHPELDEVLRPMIDGSIPIEMPWLNKLSQSYPQLSILLNGKSDPNKLRKFAEDNIEARFERVPGISNGNVFGGREEEMRVVVDPAKLAANRLTIADLRRALIEQNKNTSGGDVWEGKRRHVIRTLGLYESPEQVSETIVAIRDNSPVRVKDVATVGINYKKPDGVVRQQGTDALAVNAQQSPGTNVLEIMGPTLEELDSNGDGEVSQLELADAKMRHGDSLRIAMGELNLGILKQRGLYLEQVYDQTEYINSATELVQSNIIVGGLLAIAVLLIFLRSPRSVLIIGLTIPISIIGSFLFVRGFGRSINVISLAGMAFAVGMTVDNAIVVLENIYRHYQNGERPATAAARGAVEVWGAVLASTLTTLAVFIPVIFVQGQAGQLFRDIAIAISCAVGLSLIASIAVIPAAARWLLRERTPEEQSRAASGTSAGDDGWGMFGLVKLAGKVNDAFASSLDWVLRVRGSLVLRVAIVVLFVVGSLAGAVALAPQTEYLPEGNRNLVFAILLPPAGYNVDHMIAIGREIEKDVAPHWEARPGTPEAEALDGPLIQSFFFVARGRNLFMGARAVDETRAADLIPVLHKAASKIPGVFAIVSQSSLFESGLSGGRTIDIEITGPDLEQLIGAGGQVMQMVTKEFPPAEGNQPRPVPSLDLTSPELHVLPDWEQAAELGVSANELGYAVDALVDGAYVGDYWHQGRAIDLVIFGAEDYARHTQDLAALPISTPGGQLVRISSVAKVQDASGPEQVNHIERMRAITIQLKLAPTIALETGLETVNSKIRQPMLESKLFEDGQYQIRLAGTADKLQETRIDLQWNLVLAMVITYLLMAALFESFFYPLVIMTSVLLGLVGGLGGLAILNLFDNQPLDMLTMLGFVILIGTVVNNAILIVHQSLNNMREEGMPERQAIVESTRTRVRPILMSTLTTVLGMLPLVLPVPSFAGGELAWVSGAGSELYRGLGSVVLGGLIVSTVFTMVLVPIGFSVALDIRNAMVSAWRAVTSSPRPSAGPPQRPTPTQPAGVGGQD